MVRLRRHERVFQVQLTIQQLIHVPATRSVFVCGWECSKKKYAKPAAGETSARKPKNSTVSWDESFSFMIRVFSLPSKPQQLLPSFVTLSIVEFQPKVLEALRYGCVYIDLAESAGTGTVTKRLLLEDCKLNSMIKLSIRIVQQSGDRIFSRTIGESTRRGEESETSSDDDYEDADTQSDELQSLSLANLDSKGSAPSYSRDNSGAASLGGSEHPNVTASASMNSQGSNQGAASTAGPGKKKKVVADAFDKLPSRSEFLLKQRYAEIFRSHYPEYISGSRVDAKAAVDQLLESVNLLESDTEIKTQEKARLDLALLIDTKKKTMSAARSGAKSGNLMAARETNKVGFADEDFSTVEDIADRISKKKHDRQRNFGKATSVRISANTAAMREIENSGSFEPMVLPRSGSGGTIKKSSSMNEVASMSDMEMSEDKTYLDVNAIADRSKAVKSKTGKRNTKDPFQTWAESSQDNFIKINFAGNRASASANLDASFSRMSVDESASLTTSVGNNMGGRSSSTKSSGGVDSRFMPRISLESRTVSGKSAPRISLDERPKAGTTPRDSFDNRSNCGSPRLITVDDPSQFRPMSPRNSVI